MKLIGKTEIGNLICPRCKGRRSETLLQACPNQYEFSCNCGFLLLRFERENKYAHIMQWELDDKMVLLNLAATGRD